MTVAGGRNSALAVHCANMDNVFHLKVKGNVVNLKSKMNSHKSIQLVGELT